ncbi:hypothetical protein AB0945_26230 [Streptomyces sp. NPDC005474]|uniref:hypothetical protein n=1 Tax=Streptomyces sp. NPDC005474 TaxID=3154878 RepID=UPI003451FE48
MSALPAVTRHDWARRAVPLLTEPPGGGLRALRPAAELLDSVAGRPGAARARHQRRATPAGAHPE